MLRKKYYFAIIALTAVVLAAAWIMQFPRQPAAKAAGTALNWTISPTLPWRMEPPVVFNNKLWIIGGYGGEPITDYLGTSLYNDVWSSSDGVTWTEVTANTPWKGRAGVTPVVFNNKLWIIGGYGYNDVWSSSDGVTWTEVTANAPFPAGSGVVPVVYNNKLWIIDSVSGNTVWSSSDGVTWTEVDSNTPWTHTAYSPYDMAGYDTDYFLSYNGEMWVMDSSSGDLWSSTDGVTWTEVTASLPGVVGDAIVFNSKLWIMNYNNGNNIWSSSDGVTWTKASSNVPYETEGYATAFNGDIVVMGSTESDKYNDVWISPDGVTWTKETTIGPWPSRADASVLSYGNKLWIMGGDGYGTLSTSTSCYTDVWSSSDGTNWNLVNSSVPWGGRCGAGAVVFNNKMWLLGGFGSGSENDVWSSSDGVTWTEATANAPWAGRDGASIFVFNNELWVMGGEAAGSAYYNDVWSSSDGVTWTEATANAPWPGTYAPSTHFPRNANESFLIYDNEMWVIDSTTNNAWYSTDGVTWTAAAMSAPWAGRYGTSVASFNNAIWLLGGTDGQSSAQYYNDVWSAVPPTTCTGPFTFTFADPTLTPGTSIIRAVDITELRTDINTLRSDAGLSAYSFTDPTITPGVTPIRAIHITDLRNALADVYAACGQSVPTYTDPTLTPGASLIRAVDINELRSYISSAR